MSYAQPITTRVQTGGWPRHTGTPPVQALPLEFSQHDVGLFPWSSSCRLGPKLWPQACLLHTFRYVCCLSPACPSFSAWGDQLLRPLWSSTAPWLHCQGQLTSVWGPRWKPRQTESVSPLPDRGRQGRAPEGSDEGFLPASSLLGVLAGNIWSSQAVVSASVFTWHSPSSCVSVTLFIRTLVISNMGPALFQCDLIFTNHIYKKSCFQIRLHCEVPDARDFGGVTI